MIFAARPSLGQIEEYKVETVPDAKVIVNANEANWNLPETIRQQLQQECKEFAFNRYPPMQAENLCKVLSENLGVEADSIIIGNGSSELLQQACYAFGGSGKRIAFPYPSFSMYAEYVQLSDSIALPYNLTEEGYLDVKRLLSFCQREQPDLLIICNPNNPTGNFNPLPIVEQIMAKVSCPIIMDEAYMEFAQVSLADSSSSTLSLLGKYHNFLCLRTFSKAYGLAGMRVGYGTGARELIKIMQKVLLPYHVNAFSLLAAEKVYRQRGLFEERIRTIKAERESLRQALTTRGFHVFPSATNFLLVQPGAGMKISGNELFEHLLKAKILVRNFSRHPALPGALRITMGTVEENAQILYAVSTICQGEE